MPDNDFATNFTWFEWSFVSPDAARDEEYHPAADRGSSSERDQRYEVWNEDNRWTT